MLKEWAGKGVVGHFFSVLRIRIRRIRMFLHPDLLVTSSDSDSDPDPSIIKQNSKKNLDCYSFVPSFMTFYL